MDITNPYICLLYTSSRGVRATGTPALVALRATVSTVTSVSYTHLTPPPLSCPASFAAALDTTSEMTMVYTRFCPRKK